MKSKTIATALAGTLLFGTPVVGYSEGRYGPGASDAEIKIGHTTAYSGPVSALGATGRPMQAYFRMVNEAGGIKERKVNLVFLDDAYSPPKAVEQTRKLVEDEGVLAIYGVTGSPTNAATPR